MTSYWDQPNDFESVAAHAQDSDRLGVMYQSSTPNKEHELHSECGVCGRDNSEKVLIGSLHEGGDGHAASACAQPK
jgi:hypothetical protein